MCRHNRTASFSTRHPTKDVLECRQNAQRLREWGKDVEALEWDEKARVLDIKHEQIWKEKILRGISSSNWGSEGSQIDHMSKRHCTELNSLIAKQATKYEVVRALHTTLRRNFNTHLESERARVRCLKFVHLRPCFVHEYDNFSFSIIIS